MEWCDEENGAWYWSEIISYEPIWKTDLEDYSGCPGGVSPAPVAPAADGAPAMNQARRQEPQQVVPETKIPCRITLRKDPIPFVNTDLMQDYVDNYYGTEKAGDLFWINQAYMGDYYVVDSVCDPSFVCDTLVLIAGDQLRATRTAPMRSKDLVRGWAPEVVYSREAITYDCNLSIEQQLEQVAAQAAAVMMSASSEAAKATPGKNIRPTNFDTKLYVATDEKFKNSPAKEIYYYECKDSTVSYFMAMKKVDEGLDELEPVLDSIRLRICEAKYSYSVAFYYDSITCDTVTTYDTVYRTESRGRLVRLDEGLDELTSVCKDTAIINRIDTILHIKCLQNYNQTCDTIWDTLPARDTMYRIYYDSVTVFYDTIYDLGDSVGVILCPMYSPELDTMNIVMEARTKRGCEFIDTFQIIRLKAPRNVMNDTFVVSGDTLHLFGEALAENSVQWWTQFDNGNNYYNSTDEPSDLILDPKAAVPGITLGSEAYDSISRFVGDTIPMRRTPGAFRGDTVDMLFHTYRTYPEHNNRVCHIYDTVAVEVLKGFEVGGYVSYDSFWLPGAPLKEHRPIANVKVYLYQEGTDDPVDSATSDRQGYYTMTKRWPAGKYHTEAMSPQKQLEARNIAISVQDGTFIEHVVAGLTNPYITTTAGEIVTPPNTKPDSLTKKTMIYVASNTTEFIRRENPPMSYPHVIDYSHAGTNNSTQIQYYVAAIQSAFTNEHYPVPNWKYSIDTFYLNKDIDNNHIYGVMMGDATIGYFPEMVDNSGNAISVDGSDLTYSYPNAMLLKNGVPVSGVSGWDHLQDRGYGKPSSECPNGDYDCANTFSLSASAIKKIENAQLNALELYDTLFFNGSDQFVNIPVLALTDGPVQAMQMFMTYPERDFEVLSVNTPLQARLVQNLRYNEIIFNWISSKQEVKKGDVLANVVFKVNRKKSLRSLTEDMKHNATKFGVVGGDGNMVPGYRVAVPHIVIDNSMPITVLDSLIDEDEELEIVDTTTIGSEPLVVVPTQDVRVSKILSVIPNPMSDRADVTYSLSDESIVTMKLFNLLGVEIKTLMLGERQDVGVFRQRLNAEDVPNGVYILRMETVSGNNKETSIEKIVVNR